MYNRIMEIYEYRDMIYSLVKRDLRGRYQKSVLGMLWTLLNPLFQILIFTFVFTFIFPSGIDKYYLHLMVAMMPWNFFSESLGQGTSSIIANSDMTKKIYFPREVLPIASVTAKFINMLLAFIIVFFFVFISGTEIKILAVIFLPIVMSIEYIFVLGCVLFFCSITVYLRDMEYIVGVLLQAWIWATPVMYSVNTLSPFIIKILHINPMTSIILAYRNILYYHSFPQLQSLFLAAMVSIGVLFIGEFIFLKLEKNFAEEL